MLKFKTPGVVAVAYSEHGGNAEMGTVGFGSEHFDASRGWVQKACQEIVADLDSGRLDVSGAGHPEPQIEPFVAVKLSAYLMQAVKQDRWDDARPLAFALAKVVGAQFLIVEDQASGPLAGQRLISKPKVKTTKAFMKLLNTEFKIKEVLKTFKAYV
jgi:hypothetical protein